MNNHVPAYLQGAGRMHRRLSAGTWQSEYGRALTIAFEMNRLLRRGK
jgi:hypothetical protein